MSDETPNEAEFEETPEGVLAPKSRMDELLPPNGGLVRTPQNIRDKIEHFQRRPDQTIEAALGACNSMMPAYVAIRNSTRKSQRAIKEAAAFEDGPSDPLPAESFERTLAKTEAVIARTMMKTAAFIMGIASRFPVQTFGSPKGTPAAEQSDQQFIFDAVRLRHETGVLEIDQETTFVDRTSDGRGAWVQAWLYVPARPQPQEEECQEEQPPPDAT